MCGGHHVRERVRSVSTSTVTKDTVVMVALSTSAISLGTSVISLGTSVISLGTSVISSKKT